VAIITHLLTIKFVSTTVQVINFNAKISNVFLANGFVIKKRIVLTETMRKTVANVSQVRKY